MGLLEPRRPTGRLERYRPGQLDRPHQKDLYNAWQDSAVETAAEVMRAEMQIDGVMEVTEHLHGRAVELDRQRKFLASQAGDIAQELYNDEINAIRMCARVRDKMYRGY